MSGIIKIALLIATIFVISLLIAAYWALKPLEEAFIATANTTVTGGSANITNYFGFAEVVNFWPVAGWILLLATFAFTITGF